MAQLDPASIRPASNRLKRAAGHRRQGLKQCITDEGADSLDTAKMEQLFLSLA